MIVRLSGRDIGLPTRIADTNLRILRLGRNGPGSETHLEPPENHTDTQENENAVEENVAPIELVHVYLRDRSIDGNLSTVAVE